LHVGQELLVLSGESRKIKFIFKQKVGNPNIYFDNYDEYLALYGEADDMQEQEYPRAKSSRQFSRTLKQKSIDRAEILYPELIAKKVA